MEVFDLISSIKCFIVTSLFLKGHLKKLLFIHQSTGTELMTRNDLQNSKKTN